MTCEWMEILTSARLYTFAILWMVGFEMYGLQFLIVLFFIYTLLAIVDTLLWLYLSKRHLVTSSRDYMQGITTKGIQGIIMLSSILMVGALNWEITHQYVELGASVLVSIIVLAYVLGQYISILENLAIISHGREKDWLEMQLKWFGIGQKKLEKKMGRYLSKK